MDLQDRIEYTENNRVNIQKDNSIHDEYNYNMVSSFYIKENKNHIHK